MKPLVEVLTLASNIPHFWAVLAFRLSWYLASEKVLENKGDTCVALVEDVILSPPYLELPTMAKPETRAGLREYDSGCQGYLLHTAAPKVD